MGPDRSMANNGAARGWGSCTPMFRFIQSLVGIKECQKHKRAPGSPVYRLHDSRVSEMRYPAIWGTIIQYVFWRYIRPGKENFTFIENLAKDKLVLHWNSGRSIV